VRLSSELRPPEQEGLLQTAASYSYRLSPHALLLLLQEKVSPYLAAVWVLQELHDLPSAINLSRGSTEHITTLVTLCSVVPRTISASFC